MGTIMRKYVDSYKQASTLMAERVTSVIPIFLALSPVDIAVLKLNKKGSLLRHC